LGAVLQRVCCQVRRFAATALAAVVTLGLFGCGSLPSTSALLNPGRIFGGPTTMGIAPIIGAPEKVTQQLTQALVAAGTERGLTLTANQTGQRYTLRGYLVATPERKGSKISYIWDVSGSGGERVTRVSGDEMITHRSGRDPWGAVDDAALRQIAAKTASQLAAGLSGGFPSPAIATGPDTAPTPRPAATAPAPAASPPPTRTASASGSGGVLVTGVSGAPGDGEKSLANALKKRLSAGGIKLASAPAGNVYTVKAKVSLTNGPSGRQNVRIDWQVTSPRGGKLGTVSQQNTIPKGSLNGPWGPVADAAARAAADKIIELLPKSRT
jgi:hypothetical protein